MAEQIEEGIQIAAPAEAVWRFLVDTRTWPLWWASLVEVKPAILRPLADGARFVLHVQPSWLGMREQARVEVANPPRSLIWSNRGLVAARHAWFLEERDEGTRVIHRLTLDGLGAVGLRLLRQPPALADNFRRSLRSLKRLVETAV